jgi:DNA polymerase-1
MLGNSWFSTLKFLVFKLVRYKGLEMTKKKATGPNLMDMLSASEEAVNSAPVLDDTSGSSVEAVQTPAPKKPTKEKQKPVVVTKNDEQLGITEKGNYTFAEQYMPDPNEMITVDTETFGLGRFDKCVGVGIMGEDEHGTYIPYAHKLGPNVDREGALEHLRRVLGNANSKKLFFNMKFDLGKLLEDDIIVMGELHDAMIMASLLDENRVSYQLKKLAALDAGMPPDEQDLLQRWLAQNGFKPYEVWEAPAELVGQYCYGDCLRTKRLWDKYRPLMDDNLYRVYQTECAIAPVLLLSEKKGVRLDMAALNADKARLTREIAEGNRECWDLVGSTLFNYASGQHLATQLMKWGIPVTKTDKGNPALDATEMEKLTTLIPTLALEENIKAKALQLLTLVLSLRGKTHYLSTFVEGFMSLEQGGRLYPNFNSIRGEKGGAVTGRMSSSDPNMQNIPLEARKYLIPDEGMVWLSIDYSQIEFRLFAHYAVDKKIIDAYHKNPWVDYHQIVADLLGIPRKRAKNMNFGLLYAMGKQLLADNMGITLAEAEKLFDKYHAMFPSVKKLRKEVETAMTKRGFVRNLFGRYRRLEGRFTYKALNSLIQGGAADLFKHSVKRVYYEVCYEMGVIPLLYVHDEIVFQLPEAQVYDFLKKAVPVLQDFPQIKVPIRVDCEIFRNNWQDGEELKLAWNGQKEVA